MSVSSQPFRLVLSLRGTPFSEGPTAERDRRLEVHSPLLLADGSKPNESSLLLCRYTPHIILPCYDNFNPTALLGPNTRTCTLYQQKPQRYVLPHLARTRDGDGKPKPLVSGYSDRLHSSRQTYTPFLIRIPPEKKRRYTSFSLGSLPQSCSAFFYVVFSSPRLIDVCCFHLVPSAQNGKFGVGMDMGCTVVFLFGAVLLLFGLHHGVQLDRIGAWGRGGGREGSNASGRSAFSCFCSGHTQPPYLFYSLSLSRVTFWFSTTHHYRPKGKLSHRKYKIRQIPDRTNQQPRDVMQNSACICF